MRISRRTAQNVQQSSTLCRIPCALEEPLTPFQQGGGMQPSLGKPSFNIGQSPVPCVRIGFQSCGDVLPTDQWIGAEAVEVIGAVHGRKDTTVSDQAGEVVSGVQFPVPLRVIVGRVEDGVVEEQVGHARWTADGGFLSSKQRGGGKATASGWGGSGELLVRRGQVGGLGGVRR